jgi:hypothetical protein
MLFRMLEYKAMLMRKFPNKKILQYVIFLGSNPPRMINLYESDHLMFRYNLAWLQQVDYKKFVNSSHPEEIVLAVLADFGKDGADQVAETIFEQVRKQAATELEFQRYMEQLRILSNIRNVQPLIEKIMEKVARFFVEERDPFYKKGKLEGKLIQQRQFVRNLLESGFTDLAKIASLADVTMAFVLEIKSELEQTKDK